LARGKKYTADFSVLVDLRLRYFQSKQDAEGCRTSAEMWERLQPRDIGGFYKAACFRAITAAVIRAKDRSPAGTSQAGREADQAVAWLQKAVAAGFKDATAVKKDDDLADLRSRDDFKRLVAELEKAGQKK
jgi:hypothetical protein